MRKLLALGAAFSLVLGVPVAGVAEDLVCTAPLVPTSNGGCDSPPVVYPDYSNVPRQYADAGNGLVVELPLFNPDGSAYRHGVDPLPIVPNPRTREEVGIDSSTPLQTLADDTIVPLSRPVPSSYADQDVWPFGLDSMGRPVPAPLYNADGTPYVHGVSPLPYIPQKLPEFLPLPPRFTAADFKKLTSEQISNMNAGDFSQLPASVLKTITENQAMLFRGPQIATFTPSDAMVLSPAAVAAIPPSEFKAIKTKAFAAFKPTVIDELTVEHLDVLTAKHFAALKALQVAKFDADQVEGFDPADIRALVPAVVGKLKPIVLAAMDGEQLEAFKAAQVKKITKSQKKALTAEQLKVLDD
jgi:hypothetical protein